MEDIELIARWRVRESWDIAARRGGGWECGEIGFFLVGVKLKFWLQAPIFFLSFC